MGGEVALERGVMRKLMQFLNDNELLGHEQLDEEGRPTLGEKYECRVCEILHWLGIDSLGHQVEGGDEE